MTRLYIAWLTLAAMCILLVFKVNLHSDLLFLDSVAVDLFEHGGTWSNWKITPAPAYFPDMLAYAGVDLPVSGTCNQALSFLECKGMHTACHHGCGPGVGQLVHVAFL
jgi:hypothetical protein